MRQWPEEDRHLACYQCWAAKEAYLKARGLGLTLAADRVELALQAPDSISLRAVAGDLAEARRWTLRTFSPCPGYVGALVVARTPTITLRS